MKKSKYIVNVVKYIYFCVFFIVAPNAFGTSCDVEKIMEKHYIVKIGGSYFPMPYYYSLVRFNGDRLTYDIAMPLDFTIDMSSKINDEVKNEGHIELGKLESMNDDSLYESSNIISKNGFEYKETYFDIPSGKVRVIWITNNGDYLEFSGNNFGIMDKMLNNYICLNRSNLISEVVTR